jgi:hypothetical protein
LNAVCPWLESAWLQPLKRELRYHGLSFESAWFRLESAWFQPLKAPGFSLKAPGFSLNAPGFNPRALYKVKNWFQGFLSKMLLVPLRQGG